MTCLLLALILLNLAGCVASDAGCTPGNCAVTQEQIDWTTGKVKPPP